MILERSAPAKINLGLHVLRKRQDGYHDIETVFVRIDWGDLLRIAPANSFSFTCSDPSLPTNNANLCVQAAYALMEQVGRRMGAALHLEKRLPYGAGLGSGSSDAANTLLLLREFWKLSVSEEVLHQLASDLGSDVPFFLEENASYGTGRGEILTPLFTEEGLRYKVPFTILVIVPDIHISTQTAYSGITPQSNHRPDLRQLVLKNDLRQWRRELVNDFETSVFDSFPRLAAAKNALMEKGAGYAAMSGSGSALFGMFEDREVARGAYESFLADGFRCWVSE